MRVAFTLFGDDSWTGGLNYLRSLLSAVTELPDHPIEPVLFVAPETSASSIDSLRPYLSEAPIVVAGWSSTRWNKMRRFFDGAFLQCDRVSLAVFRDARVDVVFQNDAWYGLDFPLPTLVWIADFQHKHLTEMFSFTRRKKRDLAYSLLCRSASRVMVSSEDARRDCEQFFRSGSKKIAVVPFAVQLDGRGLTADPFSVLAEYGLPARYFYLPGQLWRHKNHLALIDALRLLRDEGLDVVVVATGNPKDRRNPEHPASVLAAVKAAGLDAHFRFLGMVPYGHIMPLMRASVAMVNPSLFEGWSTTVEEAKVLGVPMLLSDLRVHHEQAGERALYFDPRSSRSIADVLSRAWAAGVAGPRSSVEADAISRYRIARTEFGRKFASTVAALVESDS